MLSAMVLSQLSISSSKIVKPRPLRGVQYMGYALRTWSEICSVALYFTPFVQGKIEPPKTISQEFELNLSCSGQAHFNRSCRLLVMGKKSIKPGRSLTLLDVPFMIRPLGFADA